MTLTYTLLCVLLMVISWTARGYWDRLRRRYAKPRTIDFTFETSPEAEERFRRAFGDSLKGYFDDGRQHRG